MNRPPNPQDITRRHVLVAAGGALAAAALSGGAFAQDAAKGEKKSKITLRLRYYEAEAKSIEAILKTAAEQYGLKDIGEALLQIATEWAAEHGGGVAEVEDAPKQRAATNGKTKAVAAKAAPAKASATVTPLKKAAAKRAPATV